MNVGTMGCKMRVKGVCSRAMKGESDGNIEERGRVERREERRLTEVEIEDSKDGIDLGLIFGVDCQTKKSTSFSSERRDGRKNELKSNDLVSLECV